MSRPRRSKKPTTYFGYNGSDDDDDFATSPPKKTKGPLSEQENGSKCCTSEAAVSSKSSKTGRLSHDERRFQKDLDSAIHLSSANPHPDTHTASDTQCSDENGVSLVRDKENVLPVSNEDVNLCDGVHSGDQGESTVERDCGKQGKQKRKTRHLQDESDGDETDKNDDTEYQASVSSETDVEDDNSDDFSNDSDNSYDTACKGKKEKKGRVTKVRTENRNLAQQRRTKPTNKKSSKSARTLPETVSLQSQAKSRGSKASSKQKGASIARSTGKSKSESQGLVCNSSTLTATLSTVKRPIWVPPAKTGQNNLGGVKITSPCSSIRLGLSRNIRVGQPLHPTVRRPP